MIGLKRTHIQKLVGSNPVRYGHTNVFRRGANTILHCCADQLVADIHSNCFMNDSHQQCDSNKEHSWTSNNNLPCSDNSVKTKDDRCVNGACRGTAYTCLPCENQDGSGCPLKPGYCIIQHGGRRTCFGDRTLKPGNPCQVRLNPRPMHASYAGIESHLIYPRTLDYFRRQCHIFSTHYMFPFKFFSYLTK